MADPPRRVCWDACAWIGFIAGEPDKIGPLRQIWDSAQRGGYEIWTSTYAYLEVFKIRSEIGDPIPPEESDRIIDDTFKQPHVKLVQLDSEVAKLAARLRRQYGPNGLKKRSDAIYLATAVYHNLDELHTWDGKDLLPLDHLVKNRDGNPLRILIPGPEVAGPLFAHQGDTGDGTEEESKVAGADSQTDEALE